MKYYTALSSEVYHIDPRDLVVLSDVAKDAPMIESDEVVILLGNSRDGSNDKLYQGRDGIERAVAKGEDYIPVRVAFYTRTPWLNFIASLVKGIRKHYNGYGSNVYHVRLKDLEALKIERGIRTEENAYHFSYRRNERWTIKENQREEHFSKMDESFKKNGFDDKYPMDILLCRAFGVKDNLHQGHHRMMFSRKYGVERVAVKFVAASHMVSWLRPLFVFLSKVLGRKY